MLGILSPPVLQLWGLREADFVCSTEDADDASASFSYILLGGFLLNPRGIFDLINKSVIFCLMGIFLFVICGTFEIHQELHKNLIMGFPIFGREIAERHWRSRFRR